MHSLVQVKVCEQRNLCIPSLKQTKNAPKKYRLHVSLEEHDLYTTARESPCIPTIPSYAFCLVWEGGTMVTEKITNIMLIDSLRNYAVGKMYI